MYTLLPHAYRYAHILTLCILNKQSWLPDVQFNRVALCTLVMSYSFKGVKTRSMVDPLSELCFPLKGRQPCINCSVFLLKQISDTQITMARMGQIKDVEIKSLKISNPNN